MILKTNSSDVTCIGDIQENAVSIDAKNINHIVTILSSNLYSRPVESFFRETISNALDSHVEAGVTEPIIITIKNKMVAIRDYGTGISPERFNEIYLKIGSSTKRQSNDYIGSFGIGRFAALAVSDLVNITSYYNGKKYCYVMVKEPLGLKIDLLSTEDTKEHNGVEVRIPTTNLDKFIAQLNNFAFFKNIYVDGEDDEGIIRSLNNRELHEYNNFYEPYDYISGASPRLLIGSVLYDYSLYDLGLDTSYVEPDVIRRVYPKFEIGELDITPNRETVIYTERTKKAIREKLFKCMDELHALYDSQYSRDFTNVLDYLACVSESNKYVTLHNSQIRVCWPINATYKGINYQTANDSGLDNIIYFIKWGGLSENFCWFMKGSISRGMRAKENSLLKMLYNTNYLDNLDTAVLHKILVVPASSCFRGKYLQAYLSECYGDNVSMYVCSEAPKKELMHIILWELRNADWKKYKPIIKDILSLVIDNCIFFNPSTDADYLEFKKTARLEDNKNKVATDTVTWYITETSNEYARAIQHKFANIEGLTKWVSEYYPKHLLIRAQYDDPMISKVYFLYPNALVVAVAKTNAKYLKYLPSSYQDITTLMSQENRKLCRMATMRFLSKKASQLREDLSEIIDLAMHCNYEDYKKVRVLDYATPYALRDILDAVPQEKYDSSYVEAYKIAKKYNSILETMHPLKNYLRINSLFGYLCMKKHLCRLSYDNYQQIKFFQSRLCLNVSETANS